MPGPRLSNRPLPEQSVNVDDLIDLLAPALGRDKGQEAIITTAAALGYRLDRLTFSQARGILDKLSVEPGIVGVSARFALTRLAPPKKSSGKMKAAPLLSAPVEKARTGAAEGFAPEIKIGHDDIAMLLAHSLGLEKAKEVVLLAISELGITSERLDLPQAQAILDRIASTPGIVGVTARFAKARLILRFSETK